MCDHALTWRPITPRPDGMDPKLPRRFRLLRGSEWRSGLVVGCDGAIFPQGIDDHYAYRLSISIDIGT